MRTGWVEPAGIGRQVRRDSRLVGPEQRQDDDARDVPDGKGQIPQASFIRIFLVHLFHA